MKKVFALALAVILALGCFGALAEEKYSHTQTERAFGTMEGPWSVSAYDGYDFGADKSKMSAAPQKFTFTDATDKLVEWYSQEKSGKAMPKGKTYRFTAKYYVAEWTEGKIIYCIDRAKFFDMDDDADYMTPGYHETSIEWEADIDCNFINFYIGMNETCNGVVYMSELKVEEVVPGEEPAAPAGDVGYVGASFDSINVNGTVNFGAGDGKASEKMQPVDGTKGDVKSVTLRGWAGFDQAITAFGYRINGKDVFEEGKDFKFTTEDAVRLLENGGANGSRFAIEITTADLKGANTIVAIVKLADGTVVALDNQFDSKITAAAAVSPNTTFTFNGPKAADPKTIPPTGDATAVFAALAVAAMAVVVLKKRETI